MGLNYVTRSEMACKGYLKGVCDCGQDTFDVELSEVLENIRKHFGQRLYIISGNRCIKYNEYVQLENDFNYIPYSSDSMHMYSKAADINVENVLPSEVFSYLNNKYPNKYGIGSYETFTHIDVRASKARW